MATMLAPAPELNNGEEEHDGRRDPLPPRRPDTPSHPHTVGHDGDSDPDFNGALRRVKEQEKQQHTMRPLRTVIPTLPRTTAAKCPRCENGCPICSWRREV